MDILSDLLQAVVIAAIPVLVPFVVKFLVAQANLMLAKARDMEPDLMFVLEEAAIIAVRAAEQSSLAGFIEDKKAFALEQAQLYLDAKGMKNINLSLIEAAIEAAVWQEFNKPTS